MFSASNKLRRNRLAGWLLAWPLFCAATGLQVRAAGDVTHSPDQEFVAFSGGIGSAKRTVKYGTFGSGPRIAGVTLCLTAA